jgi:MFS family permease
MDQGNGRALRKNCRRQFRCLPLLLTALMVATDLTILDAGEVRPSQQSLRGLDWLNFLLAGALAGLGPFVVVYLASRHWRPAEIGLVLTAGGVAGLLSQVPGGELLDAVRSKRCLVALGVAMIGLSAGILALRPSFPLVLAAQVVQGTTGGFLGSAVSAISLGLVGHAALAERLGRNQRYAAIGAFTTSWLMGVLAYSFSYQIIFIATVVLAIATLVALSQIRAADIHFARACGGASGNDKIERPTRIARRTICASYPLLVFTACIALFQFANASVLPLLGETLEQGRRSSLVISALIVVPQMVVAALAPWIAQRADAWGRRPLLLIGFGALPVRAVCFGLVSDPAVLVAVQLLDGITGAALGVLTPLIIADITKGTGRFNLAQGFVGTFAGIGAALSTTASGLVAENFGNAAGFAAVAGVALIALLIVWTFMPETKTTPLVGATRA